MVIVAVQGHIWGPDTPQRPWAREGANQAHRPVPLGKDELIREMDAAERAGVPAMVFAHQPNIAVKATAMPCDVNEPYPFPSLHRHVRRVVDAYGPQRVFWRIDLTRFSFPYRQAVTLFTKELNFLADEEKEWIMERGMADWLGWFLPRN